MVAGAEDCQNKAVKICQNVFGYTLPEIEVSDIFFTIHFQAQASILQSQLSFSIYSTTGFIYGASVNGIATKALASVQAVVSFPINKVSNLQILSLLILFIISI
jgi:hypothetical protein